MENELILRLSRSELFEHMILAPHSELNPALYEAVVNYMKRYKPTEPPRVTIYTDAANNGVREKARELFREHFEDEYIRCKNSFCMCIFRQIILLLIGIILMYLWINIFKGSEGNMMLVILGNTGVFCLWELLSANRETGVYWTKLKHFKLIRRITIDFQTIEK